MKKIAYIGAGQLALMSLPHAHRLGLLTVTLDKKDSPAHSLSHEQVYGDLYDLESYKSLAAIEGLTHATLDIEHVSLAGLELLEKNGIQVSPRSEVLALIQDKSKQRDFLKGLGIPGPRYSIKTREELPESGAWVIKSLTGGYDGKGVWRLSSGLLPKHFEGRLLVEEEVAIDRELAVLIARNPKGEIRVYDPVEMLFDPALNLMATLYSPARLNNQQVEEIKSYAQKIITALDYSGILAVEFFLTKAGKLLVNEIAPRPHNSGHHTQVACSTDQFEQHLRGVMSWPLGKTDSRCRALTYNILGDSEGKIDLSQQEQWLEEQNLFYQWYGKEQSKIGRKLGHCTLTTELTVDPEQALEQLEQQQKRMALCLRVPVQS